MGDTNIKRHYRIGLAVSGGADSTALLVLMASLQCAHNFDAVVLHVDHALRVDSAEDAKFVQSLAEKFNLPFYMERFNIVREKGESLEMAARRVRLDFFSRMMVELKLDAIATGHHADDVAETFLMRLARGSGADGLAGLKQISHVGNITFIRPLLNVRDYQLREFLNSRGITWREDSTNSDTSIIRNNVRHVILPFLRKHLDEHITEHICKSAAILRGDLGELKIKIAGLEADKNKTEVKQEEKPKAKRFQMRVCESVGFNIYKATPGVFPCVCEMSRKRLAGRTLELRHWRFGDRIQPLGMHGASRKLQDVFVTAKFSPELRAELPILVDKNTQEVLWVPGYRIAEAVAVESANDPSWCFVMECYTDAL